MFHIAQCKRLLQLQALRIIREFLSSRFDFSSPDLLERILSLILLTVDFENMGCCGIRILCRILCMVGVSFKEKLS